jgi:hypothetical protein
LSYVIRDDILFIYILVLGFIGKYINLLYNLVSILQAIVPSNISRLSIVIIGAVSSRTFIASLTVVSLVATLATICTLVGLTLVNVV